MFAVTCLSRGPLAIAPSFAAALNDALPADAAPVFERLDLPPGDHELVAWLEHANGTLVAFDSVRFGVVEAVMK